MAVWQRPARVGLASFALTFAVALAYSIADRDGPPAAEIVAPADPAAVLESSGARITLGDGSVIVADRQFAYDDGRIRLLGVAVAVPSGEDRTGFRLRGGEAAGVEATGEWSLSGSVVIETEDGLEGGTSEASYADATGVVAMPGPARFEQGWMRLEGDAARYDRRGGLLHLDGRAAVELRPETDADGTLMRIEAGAAVVDRLAGVMRFTQGTTIDAAGRRMQAYGVVVRFDPDASRVDAVELGGGARVLRQAAGGTEPREMSARGIAVTYGDNEVQRAELTGDARLQGGDTGPGQLRDLSAPVIDVSYRDGAPERAAMAEGARVELFGDGSGAAGLVIDGGFVETSLQAGAAGVDELRAREGVTLAFPAHAGALRRVRARTLEIGGDSAAGEETGPPAAAPAAPPAAGGPAGTANRLSAAFDGDVEMRESGVGPEAAARDERVMRAERLEADLAQGLARLAEARFLGGVTLEAGSLAAQADRASYAPEEALFTLVRADAAGAAPRMDDERGFVQADTLTIGLDGPRVEAAGEVRGVLGGDAAGESASAVRPGVFAAGTPIHFVAGRFSYAPEESLATYEDEARLWQGSTEFRARTIVVDETTGDLRAEGTVRTRTTMLQRDGELEQAVETAAAGSGDTLFYDNERRRAAYETGARLENGDFSLAAGTIDVFLQEDARTLERIEAAEDVELELDARDVTAAGLVYDDGEGRYDLTGEPVSVIERRAGGCRETTGRTVTFYAAGDSISADGQSAERTASAGGGC